MMFGKFIANEFAAAMSKLGFQQQAPEDMELVRLEKKNVPLYYLAYFSKHDLGIKFWNDARRYSSRQGKLF